MGTLTKKVELKIDGVDYKKDYNVMGIVLVQELLRPNELRFTLQKRGLAGENIAESKFAEPKKLIGAKVTLTINAIRFDDTNEKVLDFKGIVYNVDVRHRADMQSEQLIDVRASSPDFLLLDHPHCFSYEEATLKSIVSKTLEPYTSSIQNEIKPRTTDSILYTVQYNESSYQFLTRLARRFGEWMYSDGNKWYFGEIKKKAKVDLDPRHDILDYHFQTDLRHHTLQHAHHDYLKYENPSKSDSDVSDLTKPWHGLTNTAVDKSGSLFKKKTFQHLQCSIAEENDLDELKVSTEAQLLGEKMLQMVCSGSTLRADLTIGSVIKIIDHLYQNDKDYSDVDHDELMITGITHTTEIDGHYSNYFTAYPSKSAFPPYYQSDLFPVSGAQRAKVMDNKDPEKLGRIRAQFLWQEEQDSNLMTPWMRIAQPHGGDDKGFYFIPEIDEEVMVDFENGNAEKPYVAGTLWHGKQVPGKKWPDDNNEIKAIRTRNGHTIEIHDEGNDGYIRIYDHEKENYILTYSTDEKLIKLESTGNIELYAKKDIIMEAGNDMKIKVGNNKDVDVENNISIHAGTDIKVKADSNIKQEAGSNFELKAGSSMKISSTTHDQKANASMKLDGGGMLEAKAGMVKIN